MSGCTASAARDAIDPNRTSQWARGNSWPSEPETGFNRIQTC
jgi:hypothetical protein